MTASSRCSLRCTAAPASFRRRSSARRCAPRWHLCEQGTLARRAAARHRQPEQAGGRRRRQPARRAAVSPAGGAAAGRRPANWRHWCGCGSARSMLLPRRCTSTRRRSMARRTQSLRGQLPHARRRSAVPRHARAVARARRAGSASTWPARPRGAACGMGALRSARRAADAPESWRPIRSQRRRRSATSPAACSAVPEAEPGATASGTPAWPRPGRGSTRSPSGSSRRPPGTTSCCPRPS